jgi:hypothetical protein
MRIRKSQLRKLIRESLDQEFELVPGASHKGAFRIHTPQDRGKRDVVVLKHPDGQVKAYFQSSGKSGGGYAGSWIPFEGWATDARVPKGLSYDDPNPEHTWKDPSITYGHYALMAKTYWNQPNASAKAPPGSSHDKASKWISSWVESQGSLNLPAHTITNNIKQLGNINRWLWSVGAIDRSAPVLSVSASRGRRLQFGLDKVS